MRILIVTPLYPPDIKEPAPYVKELARRLADTHTVTILAYCHMPEQIHGVRIIAIEKSEVLFIRLIRFFIALYFLIRNTDILYVQNGPSVELPTLLALTTRRKSPRTIVRLGDRAPLAHSAPHSFRSRVTRTLLARSHTIIAHEDTSPYAQKALVLPRPNARPEILPFTPYPQDAVDAYETSWKSHCEKLVSLFNS